MKVVICGSRHNSLCAKYEAVDKAMSLSGFKPTVIISGTARGPDRLGELWAHNHGLSVERYPAVWFPDPKKHIDMNAGKDRNRKMAEAADAVVAIWDGRSKGTKHMIDYSNYLKLPVFVFVPYPEACHWLNPVVTRKSPEGSA